MTLAPSKLTFGRVHAGNLENLPDPLAQEAADPEPPALRFDTITVSDDAVAVAGSVRDYLVLTADLVINGQRVPIDTRGRFFAVVRLEGYEGLSLWLDAGIHGTLAFDVPLNAA